MDHLALWAPTVVSAIIGLIVGGGFLQSVKDLKKTSAQHTVEININTLDIAKLNAWRDGYNAATHRN